MSHFSKDFAGARLRELGYMSTLLREKMGRKSGTQPQNSVLF